jgi:hypothetical protein
VFGEDINAYDVANLRERRPKAHAAISDKNSRKALVLTGLFQVAISKGMPEEMEIEYSAEANYSRSSSHMFRFRQIFVGSGNSIAHIPSDWKFNPREVLDLATFDSLNYIQEFVESLLLLIKPCEDGKPAWRSIMTPSMQSDIIGWTSHSPHAFKHICEHVLEKHLKNNEARIKGLIYDI